MDLGALAPRLKFKLHSMPRGRQYRGNIIHHCEMPWKSLTVDFEGDCFICDCDGWLPIPVGKIEQFQHLQDVWNNPVACEIQQDITDKKYTWCAVNHCGVTNNDITVAHHTLLINTDNSCNLACPSCRSEPIMHQSGSDFDIKLQRTLHLVKLLEDFDQPIKITMSGNGDPLASLIMRPLILDYQPRQNQHIKLFTNGLLLKKLLPQSRMISRITEYSISIDAGSADVYEDVRRPGKWKHLIENLDFLQPIAQQHRARVTLNFVFQRNNYLDLANFIDLCRHYGYNGNISPITDWGTWAQFDQHNVLSTTHPEHSQAVATIQQHLKPAPDLVYSTAFFDHLNSSR